MRALVIDYGAGNIHSITKALEREGARVTVSGPDGVALAAADAVVLPGVGAFGAAVTRLEPVMNELRVALGEGMPCLGVCLGMQLLFESSDEGPGAGLGVVRGHVRRLQSRRVPHIGWNRVTGSALAGDREFYFAHGFVAQPDDESIVDAWTELDDDRFPASIRSGAITGVQFHPEKSGEAGLALLRAFIEEAS